MQAKTADGKWMEVVVPQFKPRGWFWWTAQMLSFLMRPNDVLARRVAGDLASTGLGCVGHGLNPWTLWLLAAPAPAPLLPVRRCCSCAAHAKGRWIEPLVCSAALEARRLVVGMHVRRGDACNADEVLRARRSCTPLKSYMAAARRLVASKQAAAAAGAAEGGGAAGRPPAAGNGEINGRRLRQRGKRRGVRGGAAGASIPPSEIASAAAASAAAVASPKPAVVLYLATDSLEVVREAREYASEFEIVHLPEGEVNRHSTKFGSPLLWDRRVWQRYFWGQTDWTQQQAFDATAELLLLARADAFVGKFSSNLFRAAYALRAAHCDCAPVFASLDAPWCFDYGVREGRNWEFPLLNASLGRNRTDALFEC